MADTPPRNEPEADKDVAPSRALVPVTPPTGQSGTQRGQTPLLLQLFEQFRAIKLVGRKETTIHQYLLEFQKLNRFLGRQAVPEDLSDETIGRHVQAQLDAGWTIGTANKTITSLRAFANWMARRRVIEDYVEMQRLPEVVREPRAWRIEDIRQIINACTSREHMTNGILHGPFWRALILTMYYSGERIQAVMWSTWAGYQPPYLLIPAEDRKGGLRDMRHKLGGEVIAAIEEIRQPERELIFAWPYTLPTLTNHFDRLCIAAGLTPEPRNKFHKLRRTCATYVDLGGGNASQVLGHSTPHLAEKTYIDTSISPRPSAADVLPAITEPACDVAWADSGDADVEVTAWL